MKLIIRGRKRGDRKCLENSKLHSGFPHLATKDLSGGMQKLCSAGIHPFGLDLSRSRIGTTNPAFVSAAMTGIFQQGKAQLNRDGGHAPPMQESLNPLHDLPMASRHFRIKDKISGAF